MSNDITIPPEAVEAAAAAMYQDWIFQCCYDDPTTSIGDYERWHEIDDDRLREAWRSTARAAIAAALGSWPGGYADDERMYGKVIGKTIFLPLTQENTDDAV